MLGRFVRPIKVPAGCLTKIKVRNKLYVVASDDRDVNELIGNIVGANQFHGITESQQFTVEGYVQKRRVMGAVRDVFVVTHIDNVILPK